ncbi:MAG: SseB protein N-terminal domain [Actinomycetota bacterium]|jgi:hypothetical protein
MFRRNREKQSTSAGPIDHAGQALRNDALVDAMRAVSVNDGPSTRAMLFQLMLESTLVVMSPTASNEPKSWTSQAGDKLQLVTYTDDDAVVLPVFTSVAALLRFRPEGAGYVALPGSALFEMAGRARTNKIVFDPGSPTSGFVTQTEIEALSRGRLPVGDGSEVVAAETSVRIGRPAVGPSARLLDAVRSSLVDTPEAVRAWLTMIQQGDNQPEVVIAIRFQNPNASSMQAVVQSVGNSAGDEAAAIRFLEVDARLQQTLDSGAGELLYSAGP